MLFKSCCITDWISTQSHKALNSHKQKHEQQQSQKENKLKLSLIVISIPPILALSQGIIGYDMGYNSINPSAETPKIVGMPIYTLVYGSCVAISI